MVRNGGELGAGVGRFEDVQCQVSGVMRHVSQRKSCVKLRTQYSASNATRF
jgi:DNA-binding FrmR family transcriptional regulator